MLLSLMLNGNRFSSVGIMLVNAGKWPLLSTLTMGENAVSAASYAILTTLSQIGVLGRMPLMH